MAILEDRLSTTVVPDIFISPDERNRAALNRDWEAGPIAPIDTSEGLKRQIWALTFLSGVFTITPEEVGSSVIVLTGQDSAQCCLAFDQNARPTLAWISTLGIGYLYWYDTVASDFVITNWGAMGSIALYLDDKRDRQVGKNDILFWYTLFVNSDWILYHRKQRDRYTVEHEMINPALQYISKAGMHKGLRGQIEVTNGLIILPTIPPGPSAPQENLDFESGDVYWNKMLDFVINQSDPFAGNWSAILSTIPANYSTLENSVYTSILSGNIISISCRIKGSITTSVKLGFKFYNGAKALVLTETASKSVSLVWAQITHTILSPVSAVYYRIFVESDATDGIVSLDNFTE